MKVDDERPRDAGATIRLPYASAIAFFGLALVLDELAPSVVVFRIGGDANLLCRERFGMFRRDEGRCSSDPRGERAVWLARLVGHRDLFEGIGGDAATT